MTPARRLYLLGLCTLFLELLLIRYLTGSIWNLGYFPNLVLLGVFVGMGAGFLCHHAIADQRAAVVARTSTLLLALLCLLVVTLTPSVPGIGGGFGEVDGDLYFTASRQSENTDIWLFGTWFVLVVAIFAAISQYTAKVFRTFEPLRAYTLDIAGSCTGILLFMLVSWLSLPAWTWFLILTPLLLLATYEGSSRSALAQLWPAAPLLFAIGVAQYQDLSLPARADRTDIETVWSPYQKLQLVVGTGEIFANGILHQSMIPAEVLPSSFYRIPYEARRWRKTPTRKVMVIGAGSGNDVAVALAFSDSNARIDAVEIDPGIVGMGRRHHTAHPYADPRVHVTIGDGRTFVARSHEKYDLVIIALTDSLVKVSAMAQLRLENYLFTREAFTRAYSLLAPGGELLFYNHYRTPWLVQKIVQLARDATGREPEQLLGEGDMHMLVVGPRSAPAAKTRFLREDQIPTDDWPFLYLRERGIPELYRTAMMALGGLIVLSLGLLQTRTRASGALAPAEAPARRGGSLANKLAFLLMGVAFLLLETKSVIGFSLLFGTTWLNSSLVFLAVLLLVLAANRLAAALRTQVLLPVVVALVVSALVPLVYPLSGLLEVHSGLLRFVLASLLTFAPIFFANLLFSLSFRDQPAPEQLFGWNLIGATLGGTLEYTSLQFGYAALAALVAILYATAGSLLAWSSARSRASTTSP